MRAIEIQHVRRRWIQTLGQISYLHKQEIQINMFTHEFDPNKRRKLHNAYGLDPVQFGFEADN